MLAPEPSTVSPAPSEAAESAAPSASTIFLSATASVVELTVVVTPSICKSPLITTLPATALLLPGSRNMTDAAESVVEIIFPFNLTLSTSSWVIPAIAVVV